MPIEGGEVKLPWGRRENPPVAEPLAAWARAIGCEPEPKLISDRDNVRKLEYPAKSNGPSMTVVYLEGHGHHWPGGEKILGESMIGPMVSKVDATDMLWDFFQACSAR
jgi:poly(3-hydroxybutyrate) depolymerase